MDIDPDATLLAAVLGIVILRLSGGWLRRELLRDPPGDPSVLPAHRPTTGGARARR